MASYSLTLTLSVSYPLSGLAGFLTWLLALWVGLRALCLCLRGDPTHLVGVLFLSLCVRAHVCDCLSVVMKLSILTERGWDRIGQGGMRSKGCVFRRESGARGETDGWDGVRWRAWRGVGGCRGTTIG